MSYAHEKGIELHVARRQDRATITGVERANERAVYEEGMRGEETIVRHWETRYKEEWKADQERRKTASFVIDVQGGSVRPAALGEERGLLRERWKVSEKESVSGSNSDTE